MELRHLRYFTAVAAHGSFSRAAEHLHLTQPALSRQVKDLEEELGVALCVRGTNSVTLTEAGETFYEDARDLLVRADHAVKRVRGAAKSESLRVGYGPSMTAGILAQAIERFQAEASRVRIELEDLSPTEMCAKAEEGLLDLVILPAGLETSLRGFQWTELRRLAQVLVLSPKHPLARLKRVSPARLRGVSLHGLGKTNYPDYLTRLRALLKPFGVVPQLEVQINDGVVPLFAALEAAHGATILAEGIVSILPRSLEIRPFSPALPGTVILMGTSSSRPNAHAETFSRILREEAERAKFEVRAI